MTEKELRKEINATNENFVDTLLFYITECRGNFTPEEVAKIFIEEYSACAIKIAKELSKDEYL